MKKFHNWIESNEDNITIFFILTVSIMVLTLVIGWTFIYLIAG